MNITVKYPAHHLYKRYPGQTTPQETYIDLDLRVGVLSADTNPEVGNAVPMPVWEGKVRRYPLPSPLLTASAIAQILDDITPMAQQIIDDMPIIDGTYYHSPASSDIEVEMIKYLSDYVICDDDIFGVYDADEYFEADRDYIRTMISNGRDEVRDKVISYLCDYADDHNDVVMGIEDYVDSLC